MLQIIQAVLKRSQDHTKLSLLFANKTPDDILLKSRLDELAEKHPDRFKVRHATFLGGVGYSKDARCVGDHTNDGE